MADLATDRKLRADIEARLKKLEETNADAVPEGAVAPAK
jgi:porphobilinogen deaminase